MYDMDMRQYDPAIARWVVQDPVVHHDFSPYSAFDNNPVFWADPSGADSQANDYLGRATRDKNGMFIAAANRTGGSLDNVTDYEGRNGETSENDSNKKNSESGQSEVNHDKKEKKSKKNKNQKNVIKENGEILIGNIKDVETAIFNFINSKQNVENNTIIWVSHGSYNGINGQMNASDFHDYLLATSPLYKKRFDSKESITLKLYSCNTGICDAGSLANNLSLINPYAKIWAPDNPIKFQEKRFMGLFQNNQASVTGGGQFNIFSNGTIVGHGNFKK